MAQKIKVDYQAGESRFSTKAVDWMMAVVPTDDEDIELYAESEPGEDELSTHDELKAEIIAQAKAHGIDPEILEFWLD